MFNSKERIGAKSMEPSQFRWKPCRCRQKGLSIFQNLINLLLVSAIVRPTRAFVGQLSSISPTMSPAPTISPTITTAPTSQISPPSCTLCLHGRDDLFVNQSLAFTMPGLLAQTCGELLQTAALFPRDSPVCTSIRTLGFFCGCRSSKHVCTVCHNGQPPPPLYALKMVGNADASQYNIFGAPSGATLDCKTLDSAVRVVAKRNDSFCQQTQIQYGSCCGMSAGLTPTNGQFPSLSPSFEPCKICLDGSSVKFPNRTIQLGAMPVRNCSQLVTLSNIVHANDTQCPNLQLLGPYCGCPIAKRFCSFCPNGETVPFPNRPFPLLKNFQGLPLGFMRKVASDLTCGEFQSILDVDPQSSNGIDPGYACLVGQFRSGECGCSQGYQVVLVTWLFRVSSILSLIGSFVIIRDMMRRSRERRTTYHELILGTTCFDVITSIAYLFSGLLMPPPAYEGHGTHATCVLQGIMIQLGLTSLFYSVLLSVYFLLMIKFNWKESRFLKYRKYFHVPIIAVGIALTAAASTSIAPQLGFCYIAIPPEAANQIRITLLFVVPSSVALAIIIGSTSLTCYHVYSKERTTLKWSAKRNLSLTKKVCWQSFCYCIGFAVTVPCVMLNYYGDFRTSGSFWLLATASFFAPSQGFLNSLIYFHRASKGSFFKLKRLLCCGGPPTSKDEQPSTEGGPSSGSSKLDSTEPFTVSQFGPAETSGTGREQPPPFTDESDAVHGRDTSNLNSASVAIGNADEYGTATDRHEECTATGVPQAIPTEIDSPEEGGTVTNSLEGSVQPQQRKESVLFSAAAAHWLMETADYAEEPGESTLGHLTTGIAVGRNVLLSKFSRNQQLVPPR